MTNIATVEDAVSIAARAHRGQKDKAGAPYLLHPLRMMLRMDTEAAMMAAVLHDVVEDTEWTLERLREADGRRAMRLLPQPATVGNGATRNRAPCAARPRRQG